VVEGLLCEGDDGIYPKLHSANFIRNLQTLPKVRTARFQNVTNAPLLGELF
jgi:hypothetical protein